MNMIARYPIAIDLSDDARMCAMQVTAHGGAMAVNALTRQEARPPPDDVARPPSDEEIIDFIRGVRRNRAFRGRAIALLPPGDIVRSYPLRVEPAKDEPFEAALVRHATNVLDLPVDDLLLDYASVCPDPAGDPRASQVLLVAAHKKDVQRLIRLVKDAGGALEVVDSAAMALVRAHSVALPPSDAVLLCDVGRGRTVMVVATQAGILAHRNADWGTQHLIRKLLANLNLGAKPRNAEFLLRKSGLLPPGPEGGDSGAGLPAEAASFAVAEMLSPVADRLVQHFHNLMAYVRSTTPGIVFSGLFLYGRGAQVAGLADYVGRELSLDAAAADAWSRAGVKPPQDLSSGADASDFALALGLAMRRSRWL